MTRKSVTKRFKLDICTLFKVIMLKLRQWLETAAGEANLTIRRTLPSQSKGVHRKKRLAKFSAPARMSLTKLSWAVIIKLFPPRESLVSDIPAGDGNIANLFLQCIARLPQSPLSPSLLSGHNIWRRQENIPAFLAAGPCIFYTENSRILCYVWEWNCALSEKWTSFYVLYSGGHKCSSL